MLEVTVSGSYRTSGGSEGDVVDYDEVKGVMPECDKKMVLSHVVNRYLGKWIASDKRYKARFSRHLKTYIMDISTNKDKSGIIGKDIKTLGWFELQDLAVMCNLLAIPSPNKVSLIQAREKAYLEYSEKVLGRKIPTDPTKDEKARTYSYAKLPALKVREGEAELDGPKNPDDHIKQEFSKSEGEGMTREDLIALAKENHIILPKQDLPYEKLFDLVMKRKG